MQLGNSNSGDSRKGNPRQGIGRWKKGQSGNPEGRPKNEPLLSPQIRRQLREVCPHDPHGRIWLVVLAERILELACKGNQAAIKELLERIDGKVSESVQFGIQLNAVKNMTDTELEALIAGADRVDEEQHGQGGLLEESRQINANV